MVPSLATVPPLAVGSRVRSEGFGTYPNMSPLFVKVLEFLELLEIPHINKQGTHVRVRSEPLRAHAGANGQGR